MERLPHGASTQINYVTHDLERTIRHWAETAKAGPFFTLQATAKDNDHFRLYRGKPAKDTFKCGLGFIGMSMIELMQPTNDAPSLIREFLDTKGEVAQHVFPKIRPLKPEEFDTLCHGYSKAGLELASESQTQLFGRTAFFDAVHKIDLFIEVVEMVAPSYDVLDLMYDAHVRWDGTRPIRDFGEVWSQVMGKQ